MAAWFALIFAAAADSFFLSGWLFLGTAVMGTAIPLFATQTVSILEVAVCCAVGSFLGSFSSFMSGRQLKRVPFVERQLKKKAVAKVENKIAAAPSLLTAVFLGKFVGYLRPFYSLVIGTSPVSIAKYARAEAAASICWSTTWSIVLYLGVETFGDFLDLVGRIVSG